MPIRLQPYRFSGLDASLVGAFRSIADYYGMPISTSWIYGMTGMAFLHILDELQMRPNGGPPEPMVFPLLYRLGLDIRGWHEAAEGRRFQELQAEAWAGARHAIDAGLPVFAKNIDIRNQTSVVIAYDEAGYYTDSWHTGKAHAGEAIPWDALGLGLCPCIQCVRSRANEQGGQGSAQTFGGFVSLHWAVRVPEADPKLAFQEALAFVLRLEEQGSYTDMGIGYTVGSRAYEQWLHALDRDELNPYSFSLFIEILAESRHHAARFLEEVREAELGADADLLTEAAACYKALAAGFGELKALYPYQEPPPQEMPHRALCKAKLTELKARDEQALALLRKIHARLPE